MVLKDLKGGRKGRPLHEGKLLGNLTSASNVGYVPKKKLREACIDMLALLCFDGVLQRSQRIFGGFASGRVLLEIRDFGQ